MADPQDILARTIWGEARGEGITGMLAVAAVVINRVKHDGWWGSDVVAVCLKAWQFSCWNENDPNRDKLLAVTDDDPQFAQALGIAGRVIAGNYTDPTDGADSYYDRRMPAPPDWAAKLTPVATIGHHVFFRTV